MKIVGCLVECGYQAIMTEDLQFCFLSSFCSNRLFSDHVGPGRGRARGKYCQIWDIEVCAAVKGVVFK